MVATPNYSAHSPYLPGPTPAARRRKPRRPAFPLVIVAVIVYRLGRGVLVQALPVRWQFPVGIGLTVAFFATVLGWRLVGRARVKRQGTEHNPEEVRRELADSGVAGPAFPEDGSLLGSSVIVMNQHTKVLEVNTGYELYGSDGHRLGEVRQVGQSTAKKVVRAIGAFDQFFTHDFVVLDNAGAPVMGMTRPAKFFKSKVYICDAYGQSSGCIKQQNVFGRIRFNLIGPDGYRYGVLQADNLRAWDFRVLDYGGNEVASVTKTWEGWMRAAVTKADHYVIRVHWQLPEPLRTLTIGSALAIDVALKQDPRGLSG